MKLICWNIRNFAIVCKIEYFYGLLNNNNMRKALHIVLAAAAVLLLANACKPDEKTTEYVTDSHGRRLVSKIEGRSFNEDGTSSTFFNTTFSYGQNGELTGAVSSHEVANTGDGCSTTYQFNYTDKEIRVIGSAQWHYDGEEETWEDNFIYKLDENSRIINLVFFRKVGDSSTLNSSYNFSYNESGFLTRMVSSYNNRYELEWEKDAITKKIRYDYDGDASTNSFSYLSDKKNLSNVHLGAFWEPYFAEGISEPYSFSGYSEYWGKIGNQLIKEIKYDENVSSFSYTFNKDGNVSNIKIYVNSVLVYELTYFYIKK